MMKITYEGADVLICPHPAHPQNDDKVAVIALNKDAENVFGNLARKNLEVDTLRTVFGLTFYGDKSTLLDLARLHKMSVYYGHL